MTTIALPLSLACRRGFSLFEVLMCVSILGVMVSITVPMLFQTDSVYATRDRRNAQELCSTAMMAQAAGLDMVEEGNGNVLDTIRVLVRGGMPKGGVMKGRLFVVPGLSEEDMEGASKYLSIRDGQLLYSTSQEPNVPGTQNM